MPTQHPIKMVECWCDLGVHFRGRPRKTIKHFSKSCHTPLTACPESAQAMKRSVDAAPTAGGVVKLLAALKPNSGEPYLQRPEVALQMPLDG